MGNRLNRLDETVFMAVPKPLLTEFGIHFRLESYVSNDLQTKRLSVSEYWIRDELSLKFEPCLDLVFAGYRIHLPPASI